MAGDLDDVLAPLASGVRAMSRLPAPDVPASTERLLGALGAEDRALSAARFGAGLPGPANPVGELEPLFHKAWRCS
jgi:hypothetical protein